MSTTMRAKFKIDSITLTEYGEQLEFSAVCKSSAYPADGLDDDNTYARWSPAGSLKLTVTNPALHNKFKPGEKFYIDFTPAN